MKKIVFFLIAVAMMFTSCNSGSSNSEHHDFLNVDFGMSTIELFDIEGEPDNEENLENRNAKVYYYNNKEAFGVGNVTIKYWVDEKGVVLAFADFQNEYIDNKSYITEYNTIKKNLISAWGEPESIEENEEEFNFHCTWEDKSLTLKKNAGNNVFFEVSANRPQLKNTED